MTHELIYTSAPKGLKPGSRGFSTVAQTRHTPGVLAESLEALSGYKFAFPMGSSQERLNPVAYSHFILSSGGIAHHVLSRVSAAPPDYTGRSNKLAHHLVLTPAEAAQLPCGPAALMKQPDFFKTSWSGEPHWIEAPRSLKACEATTSVCSQWKKTTGDAGWAGKLAEQWQSNFSSPLILVFPEGLDVLPLVEESLSLLPPADRWRLTFSTYFTSLPAGVRECSLRCILAGSEEHQKSLAQVGNRIVDLTKALPSLETSSLVDDARNGTRLTKPSTIPQIPKTSKPPAIKSVPTNEPPPPVRIEVVEDPTWEPPDTFGTPTRTGSSRRNRRSRGRWAYPLIAAITALLLLAVGSFFLILRQSSTTIATTDKQPERPGASNSAAGQEPKEIKEAPPPPPVATESESVTEHPPHEEPADANTKQGQPTEAGTPKEKEAEKLPSEEQKIEPGSKDNAESRGKPSPQPPNKDGDKRTEISGGQADKPPSEPQIINLMKKDLVAMKGFYESKNDEYKISSEYPEDYIFIARRKANRSRKPIITLQKDDKTVLTFDGTPVIQSSSGENKKLLRTVRLEFTSDNQSSLAINGKDEIPIHIQLSKESRWDAVLSEWQKQHPDRSPKERQNPSQDAKIKPDSLAEVVLPGDYFVRTTFEDDLGHKFVVEPKRDPERPRADIVTVLVPSDKHQDGYQNLGKFEVQQEKLKISWQSGVVFESVRKRYLKNLFFIVAKNDTLHALPCQSPREEVAIELNIKKLDADILGEVVVKNNGDQSNVFSKDIKASGKIDELYRYADLWEIDKKSQSDVIKSQAVGQAGEELVKVGIAPSSKRECDLNIYPAPENAIKVTLQNIPREMTDEYKTYRSSLISTLEKLNLSGTVSYEHTVNACQAKFIIGPFTIGHN